MNREIKFRVWNGLEMVYDVISGRFGTFYVNPDNNGIDKNDSASLSPYNTKYHDNVPVMQFVGIKDKNGNDIYEGDILKYHYNRILKKEDYGYEEDLSFEDIGEIVFEDGCFIVKNEHFVSTLDSNEDIEFTVIGNIYQNHELLEK